MHDDAGEAGELLTARARTRWPRCARRATRSSSSVPDDLWPLPKYREMLFPV